MNLGTINLSAERPRLSRHFAGDLQCRRNTPITGSILTSLWQSLKAAEIEVYTSELTLLETLVQPIKQNNQILVSAYETLLTNTDVRLLPINLDVLRESANLRAVQNFKTPDAIHAAAALSAACDYFITNDDGFKRISNINVVILSEVI